MPSILGPVTLDCATGSPRDFKGWKRDYLSRISRRNLPRKMVYAIFLTRKDRGIDVSSNRFQFWIQNLGRLES